MFKCDDCGELDPSCEIKPLSACHDLATRLSPGERVPDGECLDCGAFVHAEESNGDC